MGRTYFVKERTRPWVWTLAPRGLSSKPMRTLPLVWLILILFVLSCSSDDSVDGEGGKGGGGSGAAGAGSGGMGAGGVSSGGNAGSGVGGAGGGVAGAAGAGPSAKVAVYPGLPKDLYKSKRYVVALNDGQKSHSSYVYTSVNDLDPKLITKPMMSIANHWTSFSFSGTVSIQVTLPQRKALTSAVLRPKALGVAPKINGNTVSFELSKPANVYLEIDGEGKHPLFVFANPHETNVPQSKDKGVLYFGPGLHDVGKKYQALTSGTVVYIAGGAYVKGLLKTEVNADPITIRGRGILSGIDYPHQTGTWENHLIEIPGSKNQTALRIEGVTLTDGPKTNIVTRGKTLIDNVKLLGWHINTDGIATGDDSTIQNSFFKVNDDAIKLFGNNMKAYDNVIWQQTTGSAFMLSWKRTQPATNVDVQRVHIIHSDRKLGSLSHKNINNAVVSCRNIAGAKLSQFRFTDFWIEDEIFQLVRLQIKDTMTGFTQGKGTIDGVFLKNFNLSRKPRIPSSIDGNGTETGEIKNVTFENLKIAGEAIKGKKNNKGEDVLITAGKTSNIVFK